MVVVIRDAKVREVAVRVAEILAFKEVEAEAVVMIAEYVIDREDEIR